MASTWDAVTIATLFDQLNQRIRNYGNEDWRVDAFVQEQRAAYPKFAEIAPIVRRSMLALSPDLAASGRPNERDAPVGPMSAEGWRYLWAFAELINAIGPDDPAVDSFVQRFAHNDELREISDGARHSKRLVQIRKSA